MVKSRKPFAANMQAAINKSDPKAYPDEAKAAGSPNIPVPIHVFARLMVQERMDAVPSLYRVSVPCRVEDFPSPPSSEANNFK
jgi:hypothetical protein